MQYKTVNERANRIMKNNATKKFAVGAVLAGVVGYVAGILTAPKSGKQTREDVKQTASKAKVAAEKQLKMLHAELTTLADQLAIQTKQAKTSVDKELNKALSKAAASKDKVRQTLSAIHEGGADDKDLDKAIKEAKQAVEHLKNFVTK